MMPTNPLIFLLVFAIAACGGGADTPSSVPTTSVVEVPSTAPAPSTTTSTTTTTKPPLDLESLSLPGPRSCPGWEPLALQVGWPADQMEKLTFIMWRESRCRPEALNGKDPNGGSTGLTQINHYWCKPNKWTANGWLQDRGVLSVCEDLYDPEVNLRAALFIWYYGVERHGYGWRPWAV